MDLFKTFQKFQKMLEKFIKHVGTYLKKLLLIKMQQGVNIFVKLNQ